jgi:succinyl-CoA synthetase alpha subunit
MPSVSVLLWLTIPHEQPTGQAVMSVLVNKHSKVLVQGLTGGEGTFHASQMLQYGTNVVGGVTPGKGGTTYEGKGDDMFARPVPVFNTVADAVAATGADVSIIFVPAAFAADAILEAIDGGIGVIICITEGIPVRDMIPVKAALAASGAVLIGPNCPGIITPGEAKIGIMPGFIFSRGPIGLVSRSGWSGSDHLYRYRWRPDHWHTVHRCHQAV